VRASARVGDWPTLARKSCGTIHLSRVRSCSEKGNGQRESLMIKAGTRRRANEKLQVQYGVNWKGEGTA